MHTLCPTCHRQVIAAVTPVARNLLLVDPRPVDGGTIMLTASVDGVHQTAITLGTAAAGIVPGRRYRRHDCPAHDLLSKHDDYCVAAAVRVALTFTNTHLRPDQVRHAAAEWLSGGDISCLCGTEASRDDLGHDFCVDTELVRLSRATVTDPDRIQIERAPAPPYPTDLNVWVCAHGYVYTITTSPKEDPR